MLSQIDLIGNHPASPDLFEKWFECNDVPTSKGKCHRSLSGRIAFDDSELIEWLARKLILHHYEETRISKLKAKYTQLGFGQYASQFRRLPKADRVKKGNATEILLIEYIQSCQNKPLIKSYKLRFNTNVDQAMKGDDALLLDLITDDKGNKRLRVFLGEGKFRKTPDKTVINDIINALDNGKEPLSYSYLLEELYRNPNTRDLADTLEEFVLNEIKKKGDIIYAGFLLSSNKTFSVVESHLSSNNPQFVFISAGIDNPTSLIAKAFERANELLNNPTQI